LFAGAVFMIRSFNGGLHYSQNIPQVVPYDACGAVTVTYEDTVVDNGCSTDFYEIITRVWTATDPSGNSTSCTSTYRLIRPTLVDVTFPAHIDLDCSEDPNDLSLTGTPSGASCGGNIEFSSEDHVVDICEGSYKVLRTWTALDWCATSPNNIATQTQIIKVLDTTGPSIDPIANIDLTTSTNACASSTVLPVVTATDDCSGSGITYE